MNGLNLFDPQGIRGVPDFWERVRRAPHRLLALDYDGTLAPFRAERALATPLNGVKEILRDIRDQRNTELAILSGRPARQVRDLIGAELRVPIYGVHGWELIHPDGTEDSRPVSALQSDGLTQAIALAAAAGYGATLERKSASVALHTRGLNHSRDVEEQVRNLWQPLAEHHKLSLTSFDHGVELRGRGRDKGTALAELQHHAPADALIVYVGDDATDEDAFCYLKEIGIGIKVGMNGESAATGRVADPAAVLQLLQDWRDVTRVLHPAERNV